MKFPKTGPAAAIRRRVIESSQANSNILCFFANYQILAAIPQFSKIPLSVSHPGQRLNVMQNASQSSQHWRLASPGTGAK
ncbi:hypothetical protein [Erythrobacter aurantius]|uniref:hypothetical protein n=1 Tax=Erythrobacter aurantius TaxID=2909249 RepID=UPI00207B00C3|nr:hypothetical protein [Erythrobacter aurantius]